MIDKKKFHYVDLSLNFSDFNLHAELGGKLGACNDGGSIICTAGTQSCPPGTCVGTSSKKDIFDPLRARILVDESELAKLSEEIQNVVMKFVKG